MLEGTGEFEKHPTPFGRIGGKSLLAKKIISLFPDVEDYDTYVEPFVGAGNIFFRLAPEKGILEVLNDKDKRVMIILRELQTNSKELNKAIRRQPISQEYFDHIKGSNKPVNLIEKFKTSFLGKGERYFITSLNRPIKTDYSKFFQDRLQDVVLTNEDFSKVIKDYDSTRTFFYLDPPYENIKRNDYPDYCTPEDVYNSIKNIKGLFALSYNDSAHIRQLFKDYKIIELKTIYNSNSFNKARQELFITNY
jgi:DNA adenine methylase